MKNKDEVIRMFKGNKSAYEIHIHTGLSIKEVYHHIKNHEEMKSRHRSKLKEQSKLPLYEVR